MIADFELRPSAAEAVATRVCMEDLDPTRIAQLLAERFAQDRRVVPVADQSVSSEWPEALAMLEEPISVPAGEAAKTPDVLIDVCRQLARRGLGRDSVLVSFGGGACGDLCGMAASIYMRGLPVAHIPTSLLAMVDASLGGKCAIDIPEGKNLVGSFWTPHLLLVDPSFLSTLPREELRAGFGEIAKYALGFDADLLTQLEALPTELLDDPRAAATDLSAIVLTCLRIKARVVEEDMHERAGGVREHLNLGHTIAHAIEAYALDKDRRVPHGLAVAFGLRVALRLACMHDTMKADDAARFEALLKRWSMPSTMTELCGEAASEDELVAYCARDKKKRGDALRVILPTGLGSACETRPLDAGTLVRCAMELD